METWNTTRPAPPAQRVPDPPPTYYVPIPRRLAADLRDAPAAVGAFALLARAFRVAGQPVPISPGDLQIYDPALSYGAATRALQRLTATGWLIPQRHPGHKTCYTPAWGATRGDPCAWDLQAPCLGRPRHISTVRLDQQLLDVCMGRLDPHPTHPALVSRYTAAPLLGLREVGAYSLALVGLSVASPALEELHLFVDGQPMPIPDEATILAVASQRDALSAEGWRRTPFRIRPTPEALPGQALFFVPPDQIGPMIGAEIAGPITFSTHTQTLSTALESREAPDPQAAQRSHGIMDSKDVPSTTSNTGDCDFTGEGGGKDLQLQTSDQQHSSPETPQPISESTRLLQSVGVRRSVAAKLAAHSTAQVTRVIAQARARADVRDLAGWVVSALRDLPTDDPPPASAARPPSFLEIYQHPDIEDDERQRWLYRFSRAEPDERINIMARFREEYGT